MATKIRLMRLGKMRAPYYRVVVADSRTKRDGRVIETIGKYHPKDDPSYIEIDNPRAVHWLRVGAQPTEAVAALLKLTGAWQEFKGLPAPEGVLRTKPPKTDKKAVFEEAARAAGQEPAGERTDRKAGGRRKAEGAGAAAAAAEPAAAPAEAPAADAGSGGTESGAPESGAPEAGAPEAGAPEAAAAGGSADEPAAETGGGE